MKPAGRVQDPPDIAALQRDLETYFSRGIYIDIENVEAAVRAAAQSEAAMFSLINDHVRRMPQIFQTIEALGQAAAAHWRDPTATQRKKRAAAIRREIAARANELRRRGVRNPIAKAEQEFAELYQHANGAALNRWLRRNR